MDHLYGILKSPNCLSMLNDNNFVACPSSISSKEPSIFTAKHFLEYCRLTVGPKEPEKPVGLSLVNMVVKEIQFKDGIVRRWELPHRIKSKYRKPHVQAIKHKKDNIVAPLKSNSTTSFVHPNLEEKPNKALEQNSDTTLKPIYKEESLCSLPPMVVNDIKSFALLDAKFREDEERNFLNESIVTRTEDFIREIKPTYSEPKTEICDTNEQECDILPNGVGGSKTVILESLNKKTSTEVIMCPRPPSAKKRDSVSDKENLVEMSKPKYMKQGKDKFKREREKGWRIRESFDAFKAKQVKCLSTRESRPSHCASEVAASTSVASNHPHVKAVVSTWQMPEVRNAAAEKIRRNKEAEKRIRAAFKTYVERQKQGRTLRALREQ